MAQQTEEAILKAAEEEFLKKGFDGARTTTIAQAAGVTHSMLHYYFRTKEAIFDRILDEKIKLMSETVLAAFGKKGLPIVDRIIDGMERHFNIIAENPNLPRFIVNEVFTHPERYEILRSRIQCVIDELTSELQQEMDAAAERGEIEKIDVRILMIDIISLNVFSFLAYPIIEPIMGNLTKDRADFFEKRKEENKEMLIRRLMKRQ